MKVFFFVFTVFLMLTVTLQESLAQAATESEEADFIEKFSLPTTNFFPQSGQLVKPGFDVSTLEAVQPTGDRVILTQSAEPDRHFNTTRSVSEAVRRQLETDALNEGTPAEKGKSGR